MECAWQISSLMTQIFAFTSQHTLVFFTQLASLICPVELEDNRVQTAIPILIGTKFDDFVQLLPDLQWIIVTQVQIPQHFLCIICSAVLIDKEICFFEIMKLIN